MDVRSIRQTNAGYILVEMGKNNSENRAQMDDAIKSGIGQLGTVKSLVPTTSLEIRDLDSLTEEDNVRSALACDLPNSGGEQRIFVTKTNSIGLKMPIVNLNEEEANHLLKTARVKIG